MGKYQRDKGKRGEREAARALSDLLGLPVTRSQQYKGAAGSADLAGVPGAHFEVKRTERLSLYKALEQAEADAGEDCPILLHRQSHKRWVVAVYLKDLLRLAALVTDTRGGFNHN